MKRVKRHEVDACRIARFCDFCLGGFSTLAWVVVSSSETNYEEDAYYGVISS